MGDRASGSRIHQGPSGTREGVRVKAPGVDEEGYREESKADARCDTRKRALEGLDRGHCQDEVSGTIARPVYCRRDGTLELPAVLSEYRTLCSTLDTAYRQVLTSFEETAQAHITFADNLINEVANELKTLEKRKEDTKKIVRTRAPRFPPPQ